MEIVSYVRVSTAVQGASGLGLDGQRACVASYAKRNDATILREFQEVESGRNSDRPVLAQALDYARRRKATLIVAKLDRLSRSVSFISALMESGVPMVACDLPAANTMTLHVMAAVAENEAKAISARTIAALAALKARGGKLGADREGSVPLSAEARAKGRAASQAANRRKAIAENAAILPKMRAMQAAGASLREIAAALNAEGYLTRNGAAWSATVVMRALKRG